MRAATPFLAIAAAAVIAAGCSGGSGSPGALPSTGGASVPAATVAAAQAALAPDWHGRCPHHWGGCGQALVIVPLSFNGTTFTVAPNVQCGHVGLGQAPVYTAPTSGPLTLNGPVTITPTCVPSNTHRHRPPAPAVSPSPSPSAYPTTYPSTYPSAPPTSEPTPPAGELYIVAVQAGSHHGHGAESPAHRGGGGRIFIIPIAGPANLTDNPWSFAPLSPGLTMQGGDNYAFFVVGVPSRTAPSPTPSAGATPSPSPSASASPSPMPSPRQAYRLLVPLSFDGANFTVPAGFTSCWHPGGAQPYTAPTSGPLVLNATVSIAPACVPSPLPSATPQVYIVAVALGNGGGGWHAHPPSFGNTVAAVQVAGPDSITDTPNWNFAPLSPGLVMTAGTNYAFFVAVALPPPPPPPTLYRLLVPLGFDGTTFTEAASSCGQSWKAVPYAAPTSGPLALTGAVSLTPACVPSTVPPNAPQLYIVALQLGAGGGNKRAPHFGAALFAVQIAGPVNVSDNPWNFTPISPGLTMQGGTNYAFFVAFQQTGWQR